MVTGQSLDVCDLVIRFGGLNAVDSLSVALAPGAFVGVVGPNGAGKSTLVQAITGFARATSGTIAFGGHRLDGRAPEQIAALGVTRTFQTSRVFPALTVRESVLIGTQRRLIGGGRRANRFGGLREPLAALLGLRRYGAAQREAEAAAERIMRLFGDRLWQRRDDPAHSLSYANRRRLDIARALVAAPDLLLLDEPTAGMNPTETNELAEVLAEVHGRFPAMTIVMVEHKLSVIRRLCHRTLVMNQGLLIVDDTPDAALDHPKVTEAYLGKPSVQPAVAPEPRPPAPDVATGGAAEAATTPPVAVRLDAIDVFYGSIQALFGVSIEVGIGEVVAVLGGNASGKSTAIKSVLRLVRPRAGEVTLFGQPLTHETTADVIAQGVASIPEGRRMFAELSVRDNLLLGAFARRHEEGLDLDAAMAQVVEQFPWLEDRLTQLAGTLSGGEQQMVAMARAWLRRPRLLCIDEPSMGLSPIMVDRVYDILSRWKAAGMTILMVEQNANRALEFADRAYVLRNGAVALDGAAATLRSDPAIRQAYLGAAA